MSKQPSLTTGLAILAAGESKRMGAQLKQNLLWRDTTLLQYAVKQAINSNVDKIFIILGAHNERIAPTLEHFNDQRLSILYNDQWASGMGSSIACVADLAAQLHLNALCILLCDQPSIDSKFIDRMLLKSQQSNSDIVATKYKSGRYGVPALFHHSYFSNLSNLNADKGAQALLNNPSTKLEGIDAPEPFFDIDTIEDYYRHIPN